MVKAKKILHTGSQTAEKNGFLDFKKVKELIPTKAEVSRLVV
jgi:hypothetical protein